MAERPDLLRFEVPLWSASFQSIAGVDEVGRGCLAGPVVAAAVIFPPHLQIPGVDDSKKLTPAVRERLYEAICAVVVACGIGVVDAAEIDAINILQASKKAMVLAIRQLSTRPDHLLIDGRESLAVPIPQTTIIQGDGLSHSIAAASIIAKVTRDRMMRAFETEYPAFRFSQHKGYGTKQHLAELETHGLTALHRRSFAPCAAAAIIPR